MGITTGYCTLVLDGQRLEKLSCTVDLAEKKDAPHYGFLGGPVKALKRAATAKQVQLELDDGRILDARVLQVNRIGMALVTVEFQTT